MSAELKQAEERIAELKKVNSADSAALKHAQRDLKSALNRAEAAEKKAAKVPGLEAELADAEDTVASLERANAKLARDLEGAAAKADAFDAIKAALLTK